MLRGWSGSGRVGGELRAVDRAEERVCCMNV